MTFNSQSVPVGASSTTPTGTYWLEIEVNSAENVWERDHGFRWNNVVRRLVSIDRSTGTLSLLD